MVPPADDTAAGTILRDGSARRLNKSGSSVVDSASSPKVPRSLPSPVGTTRNSHRCFELGLGGVLHQLDLEQYLVFPPQTLKHQRPGDARRADYNYAQRCPLLQFSF